MNPITGRTCVRRDWYSSEPSSKAFTAGRKPCPRRKIQSWKATSACAASNPSAPTPACRKVSTDSRLTSRGRSCWPSKTRTPTKPNAAFVLPLDDRVQHHGGADAGKSHDDLQDTAEDHRSVRAWADDVVRIAHRAVQGEGRYRDKGEQVEHARDKRGPPQRAHRDSFVAVVRSVVMSFSLEWIGQHLID
jgi:hypothetical protein